jgi:SAM-dependent methyltransferase
VTDSRYDLVTETTGIRITPEAASMFSTRYEMAADLAPGRRVLEIGCGAGLGFGLIGARASSLVGGDYSAELLGAARSHYGMRHPLVRLSAEHLPFPDRAFDLIACFEMTYYLQDARAAFTEMARVLAPAGSIVFANANPERPDFIRSPYSTHYHTGDEFRVELARLGLTVKVEGAFPLEPAGSSSAMKSRVLQIARRTLEALRLVPRTIEGRARLKRLIYRNLRELPPQLPARFAPVARREALPPGAVRGFKVIYVSATKPG